MNQLIKIENNNIVASDELKELFKQQKEIEAQQKKVERDISKFKSELIEAMKENGIDKAEIYMNDDESVFLTYIAPTTRTSVDTQKLKDDGLYDIYTKESPVKESLRIKHGERKYE